MRFPVRQRIHGGLRHAYFSSMTTIDSIEGAWRTLNLMRIDVEGAERTSLDGAGYTLRFHGSLVYIEVRKGKEQARTVFSDSG